MAKWAGHGGESVSLAGEVRTGTSAPSVNEMTIEGFLGGLSSGLSQLALGLMALVASLAANIPWGRSPAVQIIGALGIATLLGSLIVLRLLWSRLGKSVQLLLFVLSGLALGGVFALLGLDPPIKGAMALALLMFSLVTELRRAVTVAVAISLPPTVVEIATGFELLPDHAAVLVHLEGFGLKLAGSTSGPTLFFIAVAIGQLIRRRTTNDVSELASLGQEVAAREALLREARLDLERAVGVGEPGRFTEQRLGSFILGTILGRGGMGEIYEATHADTGEPAAIKLLRAPVGETDDILARFAREAEVLTRLESPHIVRVLEVGDLSSPLPYIAMEKLEGAALSSVLSDEDLGTEALLEMITQVAEALDVARQHNIVHRDIKASNVFRTQEGRWVVLDFGIARLAGGSGTLTGGNVVGTPGCMSPEQIMADSELDHRSDVYSCAVMAYRAITGRRAFASRDLTQLLTQIIEGLPAAPSELLDVPVAVDHVMRIGLAKDRKDRFETALDFANSLRDAFEGRIDKDIGRRAMELNRALPWQPAQPERSTFRPPAHGITR